MNYVIKYQQNGSKICNLETFLELYLLARGTRDKLHNVLFSESLKDSLRFRKQEKPNF